VIASLRGQLAEKTGGACLVEAGGVGYEVMVPASTFLKLPEAGSPVHLWTYFHVREDAQQLYGFASQAEKQAFVLLLTVKGVGPKLALALLSGLAPGQIRESIKRRRLDVLVSVPGVGKKLAERLALELSDKVDALGGSGAEALEGPAPQADGGVEKAVLALQSLGYGPAAARQAAQKAAEEAGEKAPVEAIVKAALRFVR
jgi:Holliday junction DNA helicase RuvA